MRIKLNKYLLVFAAVFALIFSSCSDLGENSESEAKSATIQFHLGNAERTALPFADEEDFKIFELFVDSLENAKLTLKDDESFSALEKLEAASITITPGEHTFTLKAWLDEEKKDGYYIASSTITVKVGENDVAFVLKPGKIEPVTAGYGILLLSVINDEEMSASKVEATVSLYDSSSSSYIEKNDLALEQETSESFPETYLVWDEIPSGLYKVLLKFFDADGVQIGYNLQYATVLAYYTSANMEEIKVAESKNDVYDIDYSSLANVYDEAELDSWTFAENTTAPGSYSRFSSIKLPAAQAEGYLFCGWTNGDGELLSKITEIAPNTRTGNLMLTPRFISDKELAAITSVKINDSNGGAVQVGDHLAAQISSGENTSFEGRVSYQWFRGKDSNGDEKISDSEWTAISSDEDETLGKKSSYILLPEDVGSKIKVEVKRKYIVTFDSENAIYNVAKNEDSVASEILSVEAGSLDISAMGALSYNEGKTVLVSSSLATEKLSEKTVTVKNQAGDNLAASLAISGNAPETSDYVSVTVSAEGYTSAVKEKAVFIKVQANAPQAPALSEQVQKILKGHIAFAQVKASLEYTTTEDPEISPAANAEWKALTAESFPEPAALYVRTKEIVGSNDTAANPLGFVAASEPVSVTIQAANKGTLIRIASAAISGDLKYGSTVTVSALYSLEGHTYDSESDGSLSFKWFYGTGDSDESWTEIEGATGESYLISNTSIPGKLLKCVISQAHPNGETYSGSGITASQVAKGTLIPDEQGSLSYTANPVILGTSLNSSNISGPAFTNQAGSSVSPTLSFVSTEVPNGSSDVSVKASLAGYEDLTLKVAISVISPIPGADKLASWLENTVDNVSLGAVKFTQAAVSAHVMYSANGEDFAPITDGFEVPATSSMYLKIAEYAGSAGNILASAQSADLKESLSSYIGKRSVVIKNVEGEAISFDNGEVILSFENNVITAKLSDSVEITGWEIFGEELSDIASLSDDKTSLTFKADAPEGLYQVTLWAKRGGNLLSSTYVVTIESSSSGN